MVLGAPVSTSHSRTSPTRSSPWGTAENVNGLMKALDQQDDQARHAAIDALGVLKIQDDKAILSLCQLIVIKPGDRGKAVKALQNIGPKSEATVVQMLQNPDKDVRTEACHVLQVVGTKASLQQ